MLEHSKRNDFLLQPPLDPHRAGGSRVINSITEASPQAVLQLFCLWNNSNPPDVQLEEWLEQVCPNHEQEFQAQNLWDDDLETMWTTTDTLRRAIRHAFSNSPDPDQTLRYQQWAIQAYQLLNEQQVMYRTTSFSMQHNVRVTATSRCIGRSLATTEAPMKMRFAYRIRIENVDTNNETVQLLGRTWHIQELYNNEPVGEPVEVHAPQTGAVGKLPVLQPGEAFEYMSGCELGTSMGVMKGCFHLCRVPPDTPSAVVGQQVEAFHSNERFEVVVQPFALLEEPSSTFTSPN